jgi:copper chaperone CopZ
VRRLLALTCLPLSALALAACGTTTSTASFKGAEHEVAQTAANLQSDVTAGEQKKVCANDLSASVVRSLGGIKHCETTIKNQISEIDNTELQVESVKVNGTTATAVVKSTYKGNKRTLKTVSFVKEGNKWKIATLQ